MKPKEVVLSFWETMRSNDFYNTSEWFTEDFECIFLIPVLLSVMQDGI